MTRWRASLAGLAALALVVCAASSRAAEPGAGEPTPPVLVVTGSAQVDYPPDEMRMGVSVVTQADQPARAMEDNSRAAARIMEALQRKGLKKEEVTTGRFNVQPIYSVVRPGSGEVPKIVAYRVENMVEVKTARIDLAGDLIQSSIEAGANRVESVVFGLADPRTRRAEVIAKAAKAARSDADAAAAAAGVTITGVRKIAVDSAGGPILPPPMMRNFGLEAAQSMPPPINPGEVTVTASVTIEYFIK